MRTLSIVRQFCPLAVSFLLVACARPAPAPFDGAAESARLMKRDAEWADLASAGKDIEKVIRTPRGAHSRKTRPAISTLALSCRPSCVFDFGEVHSIILR